MKYALMVMLFLTSGCSFRAAYPAIGGGLGGGVGSLAGPGGAIAGGIAGAGIGTAMMETGAHAAIEAKVDALTSGDVAALIKQQAAEEKSGFDGIIDGIYRVLWLLGIGAALWVFIPILYTRFIHKKLKNGGFKK
jgi:hypothetical protein